ncbi:hypothetical protein AVEN_198933-1 [Araneus ventricosus]|uniref:Uncharacterized protein n=1 Tax=Araneus ventricosus TaxID=182803 RepID=A0A4Y2IBT9_ARAVE|nr:hypothetical protein AVEN_198933-1 [Araneus ventricosus]
MILSRRFHEKSRRGSELRLFFSLFKEVLNYSQAPISIMKKCDHSTADKQSSTRGVATGVQEDVRSSPGPQFSREKTPNELAKIGREGTAVPLRMMRGERRLWVAVGDRGQSPDKSLRRNISATPQRCRTKGFLSLEFGRRRGLETRRLETRLNSELDSDSDLDSRDR